MLENTFSPLIPTDESESFYIQFYHQYCYIQINRIFNSHMRSALTERDTVALIEILENYHEDQNYAAIFSVGTGIMNPALMRRRKEKRGISTGVFTSLHLENKDPVGWYGKVAEFLMLYAICEQALKDFLVLKCNIDSNKIREDNIINKLFDELQTRQVQKTFLLELSEGSSEVITSQNELNAVWHYYTKVRHALSHAGGRSTERVRTALEDTLCKNRVELDRVQNSLYIEWSTEDDKFFVNLLEGNLVTIPDQHLSFFRNLVVLK